MRRSLTGIKPTGTVHIGNYLGAIRPALELARQYDSTLYFIADYHALTTVRDPQTMRSQMYGVAAAWLAAGLDPERTLLYRQSAVPEVFELTWVFNCLLATGQLLRGHAYKAACDELRQSARADEDRTPNSGIFNYPALMAADIVLYDTHVVPVGHDQKQHLELARDVAIRFNHIYGEDTLVVPEARIQEAMMVVGTDGRKMSKSYDNVIPLFGTAKQLRKAVMRIVTGSESLEEPKDPEGSTVYTLYRQVVGAQRAQAMADKLRAGNYGWGHAKQDLYEALEAELGPMRERYRALREDEARLDQILDEGARKARRIAHATMERVRSAIGIR